VGALLRHIPILSTIVVAWIYDFTVKFKHNVIICDVYPRFEKCYAAAHIEVHIYMFGRHDWCL